MRKSEVRKKLLARVVEDELGCWIWTGAASTTKWGKYGIIWLRGKGHRTHRVSYKLFVGPIPPKYKVHHRCEVTLCCNPMHLEAVTNKKNVQYSTGSLDSDGIYVCKRGHRVTPSNTGYNSDGVYCRMCRNLLNSTRNSLQL